ncbi:MAG TPA: ATP-binding protein [Polyangiaceae bacterium]|nr:ATP-binding protein [Polyangiaceae bacterium]
MAWSFVIDRQRWARAIRTGLRRNPVVALLGPRQCGKTTLARQVVSPFSPSYFDLEDPTSLERLAEPLTALSGLRGVIVIDEVQRRPELFPVLRVLVDRKPLPARFLVLGSASPPLLQQASESLAGRIETISLGGFTLDEVGVRTFSKHWRRQLIQTFLERDLSQRSPGTPPMALRRFWTIVAHYHGGVWNNAEPARSLGVSEPTVRRYLDLLTGLFMIRQFAPWHENLSKRQVKSPKMYVRDSGLLHELLGIRTAGDLLGHPKLGASFEGHAIEQVLQLVEPDEFYFWGTHQGAELDLLLLKNGRRIGVEIKHADAPRLTPSMRVALDDLKLDRIVVLYPGNVAYRLSERVEVEPVTALASATPAALLGHAPKRRRSTARS